MYSVMCFFALCMCLCERVCMYLCVCVRVSVSLFLSVCVSLFISACQSGFVCVCAGLMRNRRKHAQIYIDPNKHRHTQTHKQTYASTRPNKKPTNPDKLTHTITYANIHHKNLCARAHALVFNAHNTLCALNIRACTLV